jgi:hypothetical protein
VDAMPRLLSFSDYGFADESFGQGFIFSPGNSYLRCFAR